MKNSLNILEIPVEKPDGTEVIFGQGTFNLLAVEQLHTVMASVSLNCEFGLAFNEGSDEALIRVTGNCETLKNTAYQNVKNIGCGHTFFIAINKGFPIQVLNSLKLVQTVVNIYGATGNRCSVVVTDNGYGRGVVSFIDGKSPSRKENDEEKSARKNFLNRIGYIGS